MSNLIWNASLTDQRLDVVMHEESKSESKSVETLSFVESQSRYKRVSTYLLFLLLSYNI